MAVYEQNEKLVINKVFFILALPSYKGGFIVLTVRKTSRKKYGLHYIRVCVTFERIEYVLIILVQ